MNISLSKWIAAILGLFLPSPLTRPLYRLVGHTVGRNTRLPFFAFVCAEQMELGNDVDIRPFVFILVKRLTLGSNTIVSFGTQIKGQAGFQAGDNCFVGAHVIIHCDEDVRFGFYSGVGPRSLIYTHGSFLPVTLGYPAVFASVVLEDFVWTAMGVLFLPGSHVESNCIVNPGVVISGRIPSGTRLQMSPQSVQRIEQTKLLQFSKRSRAYYHQSIIRGFLTAEGESWQEGGDGTVFRWGSSGEFRSIPSSHTFELWNGAEQVASYDLAGFRVTQARDRVHGRFLSYLRRRFGLTLRTTYD
jgi:carbonic anhydrase/acetyltransferase-like protein (isoleucine patch superfamily)